MNKPFNSCPIISVVSICLYISITVAAGVASAADSVVELRNYSPFAQVYGLPTFADGSVQADRRVSLALSTTIANHADIGTARDEAIVLDGESYITELTLKAGVNRRFTVGMTIPWVGYGGGRFDSAIDSWHNLWGLSDANRNGPKDQLHISYTGAGGHRFLLEDSDNGMGDVRLSAAYQLLKPANSSLGLVVRTGLKIPTGNADTLQGSEAADVSLDLAVRKALALPDSELVLLAHVGGLFLGKGEVLSHLQRDIVGYAGAGAVWIPDERWHFNLQFYGQTSYFDSNLDQLGSESLSITAGGSYTWLASRTRLTIGLIEDLVTDAIPDVAVQIVFSKDFG